MASSIKALSGKERKEIKSISGLLSENQQKSLVRNLNKIRGLGGQTAVNKAVRNFISGTGGFEAQKKAKTGGNPDIQKKQGFVGVSKKANGGSVMKKKKKMMAKGGAAGGKKRMSKGGAAGGMKKRAMMMGGGKAKKMMKGGGKTKKYMAGGGKTKKYMARGGKAK